MQKSMLKLVLSTGSLAAVIALSGCGIKIGTPSPNPADIAKSQAVSSMEIPKNISPVKINTGLRPGDQGHLIILSNAQTIVKYFGTEADLKIENITFGFMPAGNDIFIGSSQNQTQTQPQQFVRVFVTITGKSNKPFFEQVVNFALNGSIVKGLELTPLINATNVDDLLPDQIDVTKDSAVAGALYFEVPVGETLQTMSLIYKGYDGHSRDYTIAFRQ